MIELDGSAGGGQLLRSALSLSAVSGTPFRMESIRGGRDNPGLRPQHLAAVRAVAAATDAEVSDVEVGADELTFEPGPPSGGTHEVDVGTAGSVALLFDALLPLALRLDDPLALRAVGGTDVKWAPPLDYLRRVKLPLLTGRGLRAAVDLHRRGFYPAGGGAATLLLAPSSLPPLPLAERGERRGARIYSVASDGLADAEVAERQAGEARRLLAAAGHEVVRRSTTYETTESPGSAVVVELGYGETRAGFDALGERGTPAEDVATAAAEAALAFDEGRAAVDAHMADQLVVFLALAGGEVTVPRATDHLETGLDLVAEFGYEVSLDESASPPVLSAPGP